MNKNKRYFVVEGQDDEFILRSLLPQELLQDTKIIVAGGYSAALSVAQTLLTLTPLPIVIFFDTDTFSEKEIEEKKQFINSYLKRIFQNQLLLIPFVPDIEVLFLDNKELLSAFVNREIDDELWHKIHSQPRKIIKEELAGGKNKYLSFLKSHLTSEIVQKLQESPLLQKIIKQLSAELMNESETVIAV